MDNTTNNAKKRGRPPKEAPKIISESDQTLQMKSSEQGTSTVTIRQVQENLRGLFNTALGVSGKNTYSFESDYSLQSYNPFLQNQRLKMLSTLPGQMDRESLTKALNAPQNSEIPIRSQGWSLSSSQYLYYKILRLSADIPKFKHYKIPELLDSSEYSSKNFAEEDRYIDEWIETFDIVNTLKRVSLEVKREGKPTYVLRNCVERDNRGRKRVKYATWQKMPSDYIKLIGIGEHGYIASFNMLVFLNPAISPEQYPEFIREIWYDMINKGAIVDNGNSKKDRFALSVDKIQSYSYLMDGKREPTRGILEISRKASKNNYFFWVPMPQELCYTFCSDTSNPWSLPDTAGLFLGLQELTDYDQLAGLLQSTPLTAVLTAEMEAVNNPNPGQDQTIMNPETIAAFQDKFNSSASNNIQGFFAPLKNFKLFSLPNVPNSSETTTNATKNFIYRAGLGGLIITTDKPSVTQIKTAQMIEESQAEFVTKQFETVLKFIINNLLGCEYKWKFCLWGGIFTFADEVKRDKELWQAGATFVLPKLASAYDLTLRDTRAVEKYIESLDIYSDFKTVTQATQINLSEQKSEEQIGAGRPKKDLNEIDNDNTAASIDGGLDEASTRNYVFERAHDCRCVMCGTDTDGESLCEECAAECLEG